MSDVLNVPCMLSVQAANQRVQVSESGRDLVRKLLVPDPHGRATMDEIKVHPWFLEQLPANALTMNDWWIRHNPELDQVCSRLKHVSLLPSLHVRLLADSRWVGMASCWLLGGWPACMGHLTPVVKRAFSQPTPLRRLIYRRQDHGQAVCAVHIACRCRHLHASSAMKQLRVLATGLARCMEHEPPRRGAA